MVEIIVFFDAIGNEQLLVSADWDWAASAARMCRFRRHWAISYDEFLS